MGNVIKSLRKVACMGLACLHNVEGFRNGLVRFTHEVNLYHLTAYNRCGRDVTNILIESRPLAMRLIGIKAYMIKRGFGLREAFLFITLGLVLGRAASSVPQLDRARELYDRTEYRESLNILNSNPEKDSQAYQLTGQDWFMLAEYK